MQTSSKAFLWNAYYVNLNLTKTGEGIKDHPAVCGAPQYKISTFTKLICTNIMPFKEISRPYV